jgi:hypothetical protein
VKWLPGFSRWAGLSSIGMVISRRTEKHKTLEERRFFISSLPAVAEPFAKAVRQHWSIENGSHYVLDVTFGEDKSRIRRGFAPPPLYLRVIEVWGPRSDESGVYRHPLHRNPSLGP